MIVVADSGPLIHFALLGRLDLLRDIYGRLIVPQAVYDEIVKRGAGKPGDRDVAAAEWIETRMAPDSPTAAALANDLDAGEAEAISLAITIGADLFLCDDLAARRAAERAALRVVGTLGILGVAKREGIVPAVRPLVERLQACGVWFKSDVLDAYLSGMGEA